VIQNGYGGANGSGYLADIHFHAFGPVCETSFINFSGHCVLLDTEGNKIPATWQNATVHVSPPPEWTPMDSGTTAYLWGIWGTNSSDVFAVGWSPYGGVVGIIVAHHLMARYARHKVTGMLFVAKAVLK